MKIDLIQVKKKNIEKFEEGELPKASQINSTFSLVKEKLSELDSSISSSFDKSKAEYNSIAIKESDAIQALKGLSSKLLDLSLLGEADREAQFISYSFKDQSSVKLGESSITIESSGGELSLPVIKEETLEVKAITIESSSNGTPGNNQDRTRPRNGALELITDNRPQTWFEYEKFSLTPMDTGLILTLRLKFSSRSIINRLRVSCVNFGTTNWTELIELQINKGGEISSILNEIEGPVVLNPESTGYIGSSCFTFLPKEADEIIVSFRQSGYSIAEGSRELRYAIGIREIEVQKVEFAAEGTFSLTEKRFATPVSGISLKEKFGINLPETVSYQVLSEEDETWVDLSSLNRSDNSFPYTYKPKKESSLIKIKGKMVRSLAKASSIEKKEVKEKVLTVTSAATTVYNPGDEIKGFLEITELGLAAQGLTSKRYKIGTALSNLGFHQKITLPFDLNEFDFVLKIAGVTYTKADVWSDDFVFIYHSNQTNPYIELGSGDEGVLPPLGADIFLEISACTSCLFEETERGLECSLPLDLVKIRETTRIYSISPERRAGVAYGGPGQKFIQIEESHFQPRLTELKKDQYSFDLLNDKVDFINGNTEFQNTEGEKYSIDITNNKVWLKNPIPTDSENATAQYTFILREKLDNTEWEFLDAKNGLRFNSIKLQPKIAQVTIENQLNSRVLDLFSEAWESSVYTILKNSVSVVDLENASGISRTLQTEVPFINGASEFRQQENPLGYFSIDYKNGKIYLPGQSALEAADQGFLPGLIIFKYIASEIHYEIGRKLTGGRDYMVDKDVIEFTPSYINMITDERGVGQKQLHVRYGVTKQVELLGDLSPYVTPTIKNIVIQGATTDPRLGAVSKL